MMYQLIKDFPLQLTQALEIGEKAVLLHRFQTEIKNIVICGLGGSGFGGNMFAELFRNELKVPVIVNKGYSLPAFVNQSTLLILSSYSGNTEETISCAQQALALGLKPVCLTSGGNLEQMARENKLDIIKIPSGYPPRTCLGYSIVQVFYVAHHYQLISNAFKQNVQHVVELLNAEQGRMVEATKLIASNLKGKVLIAYADEKYESSILRLKQQINENAKLHCWFNVVPEMNHNELVGWREANEALAVVIFRSEDEYIRNTKRLLFSKDVITNISKNVHEITAIGNNSFERHFYLVHFGDWLTYHLALEGGYDPMEIDVLNTLKGYMSTVEER